MAPDSFTYTVFDGELLKVRSNVSVTLTLQPVNDAPVARALSVAGHRRSDPPVWRCKPAMWMETH